ncbi:MAG: thioredoxin domain-containing protein [Planctomycetes bacterium]|nr:thioredoxin domain-containing protein [Planctomycetota bacterium]
MPTRFRSHRPFPLALATCLVAGAAGQQPTGALPPPQETTPVNRLADATSPYLLQHRHNPVDWYPWGEEALARARREDRPIFLSIGYAACHWCHVMERESFEDEAIAALMNELFVCIKVDREERPDLDEIYMAAVQAMTGHGGWPMSVWLTPDLKPFYAGTYFPVDDRHGLPSFRRVLRHVHALWTDRRELVVENAEKVKAHLRDVLAPVGSPDDPAFADLDTLVAQSADSFDEVCGGFGGGGSFAPKFPHAAQLAALLRQHARTGDELALRMVTTTLDEMARGGIYDQLGGGFHRYSVDREWLVPHFEKMLYDNALLTQVYADAWFATGDLEYLRIVRETLDYLVREMRDPAGGFWSTTDADSEGVEGRYFVWSAAEVAELCGEDARAFALRYDVSADGNWEGHSILRIVRTIDEVAAELDAEPADVAARIDRARAILYAARGRRVPPATDDKVLAAWNGMAISALCAGYRATGDARYLAAAQGAADFVLGSMRRDDGRLLRTWRQGRAQLPGYLEDHAYVADAVLRLFECDGDPRWLAAGRALLATIDAHFGDDGDGSFFFTADDHEALIARAKAVQESSQPSGIAMAVLAHLRGALLLGDEALWERGVRALRAHHAFVQRAPIGCPGLMLAVDLALADVREVVVAARSADDGDARTMLATAWRAWPPHVVVAPLWPRHATALAELSEVFAGKAPVDGRAAAFVCRRGTCDAPVLEPAALRL